MPLNMPIRTEKMAAQSIDSRPALPEGLEFRPARLEIARRVTEYVKNHRKEYKQKRIYASQIKECGRKAVFGVLGFEKGPTGEGHPEWSVSAELGTWLHERVEGWLRAIGGLVRAEFNVESEDGALGGKVDALLEDTVSYETELPAATPESYDAVIEVAGEQFVLDAKTVGSKDFKAGAKGRKMPGYVAQISVYGRLLGVTKGVVLLVSRDTGEMADYEFDIDFGYADALLARASDLMQAVQERRLPAADEWGSSATGSYFCQNLCPFYRQCAAQQRDGSVQRALDAGAAPEEL